MESIEYKGEYMDRKKDMKGAEVKAVAKGKAVDEVKAVDEGKAVVEYSFDDVDLKFDKPSMDEHGGIVLASNLDTMMCRVRAIVDRYAGTELNVGNVPYVRKLKGQFVALRTRIDREKKDFKACYVKPMSDFVDSACLELQAVVAEGEKALGDQLAVYDQKRREELTLILEGYVEDAVARHHLDADFAGKMCLLDKYYNKTQDEDDTIADIERQAAELAKAQAEHVAGVALIEAECADAGFLPDSYVRALEHRSAMEIVLEIKADRKTRDALRAKEDAGETIVVGEPVTRELERSIALDSHEDERRTRLLRVTYSASQAKDMADFFDGNGIEYEFVRG